MGLKEEVEEVSKRVVEFFLQSDEFKQIIRTAVETGFYAGARSINKGTDVVNFMYDKETVIETVWNSLTKELK